MCSTGCNSSTSRSSIRAKRYRSFQRREVSSKRWRGEHLSSASRTFPYEIEEFKKEGFPLTVVSPRDLPGYISASNGTVKLVKNCPHPNAGAAFINWYGTRKGQNRMMAATLDPSRRKDVDFSLVPSYMIPKPGIDYLDQHTFTFYTSIRPQVINAVDNILGR